MAADERWQRVRDLFEAAVELDVEERAAFLTRACGDDSSLREQVEALITTDARPPSELDRGAVDRLLVERSAGVSLVGSQVAAYRITGVVGAGGMGTVFEAEQDNPHRVVALKMMHIGLQSPAARRRFEYESEVLGQLRHPAIAQVYEAGTWREPGSGREVPFFAMELVDGARALDAHVDAERLALRPMLALFAAVCEAVHHGHQRGFIHRDLKPANILVDSAGRPKVIDFGIARATASTGEHTLRTEHGQVLGTLQYMSPEQLDLDPTAADVTSDVYSLGVILYELLAGAAPFDIADTTLHGAIQIVRNRAVVRPSQRGARAGLGAARLPAELDWIVLRAMDRDPARRFPSASELAADIRRFLADEPVVAGPPGAGYRLRKFARRHRVGLGAAVAVLLALVAGAVLAMAESVRAGRAERAARAEAATLAEVNEFLRSMFASPRPGQRGGEVRVVDVLADASSRIDELYGDRPRLSSEIRNTIGVTYMGLGLSDEAAQHLRAALAVAEPALGEIHGTTLTILNNLGLACANQAKLVDAVEFLERALSGRARLLGDDHAGTGETHHNLATVLQRQRKLPEAAHHLREAARIFRVVHGGESDESVRVASGLGLVLNQLGQLDEAERVLRDSVSWSSQHLGAGHPTTLNARSNLSQVYCSRGDLNDALRVREELVPLYDDYYGATHNDALTARNNLAAVLLQLDRPGDAAVHLRSNFDTRRRAGTASSYDGLSERYNLAVALERQDRLDDARPIFEELLRDAEKRLPPTHWLVGNFRKGYGVCLTKLGEYEAAERTLLDALATIEKALGPKNARTRKTLEALVELYETQGKPERAAAHRARLSDSDPLR